MPIYPTSIGNQIEKYRDIYSDQGLITRKKGNEKTVRKWFSWNKWLENRLISLGLINAESCCDDYVAGLSIRKIPVVNGSSETAITLTSADAGSTVILNEGTDGTTVTLPAGEVGLKFHFVSYATPGTGGYVINTAAASDLYIGALTMVDTDTSDTHSDQVPDVSNDDTITLNGTTTGGLIGSQFTLEYTSSGRWWVQGVIRHTSNVANPFS